ncbi:hypothetical protein E2C01_035314 [Portunus trituberculatus]|uniref:Uncharacterized protein n=1 Tax=Portunus trituberculatus TaxID=210409 RepID=A0A5B7F5D6_PORTR|nr:hypothetical protein [Portunus trituberculatus]
MGVQCQCRRGALEGTTKREAEARQRTLREVRTRLISITVSSGLRVARRLTSVLRSASTTSWSVPAEHRDSRVFTFPPHSHFPPILRPPLPMEEESWPDCFCPLPSLSRGRASLSLPRAGPRVARVIGSSPPGNQRSKAVMCE